MDLRQAVARRLQATPPLYRLLATTLHPTHRGRRLAAIGKAVRYEVGTGVLGKPTVLPIGDHSKLIAYKNETNVRNAVVRNPPNPTEMRVWARYLRPGDLFIDIGANVGSYTIFALDCGADVIAVEPTPQSADRIREHLALNGYEAQVVQKALSDQPGVVRITTDQDSYNHLVDSSQSGVDVEATTLDELLGDRTAAVKIDVEGAEHLVLSGATESLANHRISLLQLEWVVSDLMDISDRQLPQKILAEAGYELYLPDRHGQLHRTVAEDVPPATQNIFAMPRV